MQGSRGLPAIGIDLGTTYSCAAVWRNSRIEIIPNDQGNRITPSSVAFTETHCFIGDGAKYQSIRNYENTVFDVKRLIGKRFSDASVQHDLNNLPFKVISGEGDKPMIVVQYKGERKEFCPEQISSFVLSKMAGIAQAFLESPVKDVVVTVPAYFDDQQRQATIDAGKIAGLNVMALMNEPTAAAMAYCFDTKPDSLILIFDLGGGTFDISIAQVKRGKIEVIATTGDTHLGGLDFDNNMVRYFVEEIKKKYKKDIRGNPKALGKLRAACERAKRALSVETHADIEIDSLVVDFDFSSSITRARFEDINMHLFENCIHTVEECLRDNKMHKGNVNDIVLVGGSTKIPMIQSMLREFFNGKVLSKAINPDEAVAYGAALKAAYLSNNKVQDMVLQDVTPLSLGTDVIGGRMDVLIPRNTSIPTKKEKIYYTTVDNQPSVPIGVYIGERDLTKENKLLDKFTFEGIPPAPKGQSTITVCFEIDTNGVLTVSAVDNTNSGKRMEMKIANVQGRLTSEEIRRMVEDADKYKADEENHMKNVKAKNKLENILIDLNKFILKEDNNISSKDQKSIQSLIRPTEEWLNNNERLVDGDKFRLEYEQHVSRLKTAVESLETTSLETAKSSTSRKSSALAAILSALTVLSSIFGIVSGVVGMAGG